MSTDPNHAKAVFLAAAERPAGPEREAYLAEACGDDAELRREVEELLAHLGQAGSFLESPGGLGTTAASPPSEVAGAEIGRYKLVEPIGEGGMGEVWLAQQHEPVKRLVAVKVIRAGMDSKQVLARFDAERQALAMMDHPNIAKVLDGGTTRGGRPYFVMELVRGTPITKYCDDHRLTPRDRLGLFVQVCQAVQHAHQKGIIHRDLKPSNVLVTEVDGRPAAKVIDFGVAKATGRSLTDQTLVTGFGAVVGTPEYMSPEQAGLHDQDVDTRTDVYALGVILYELLTGTTPLTRRRVKEAALLEVLRVVREEEPPRPSTRLSESKDSLPSISAQRQTEPAKLTRLVRGELDWIVMKALEKDRNRRYETANGFALDLQRHLADEPVQACPPSARYRLRKMLRRHRTAASVAVAFVLLLLAGVAASTYFALDAAARAREAKANAVEADRNAGQARANFTKARAAVDRMLFRVAADRLVETPQTEILRKKLLEDALKFHKEFLADAGDDPAVRRDAAFSEAELAALQYFLEPGEKAETSLRRAIALLEALVRDHPEYHEAGWKLVGYRIQYYFPLRDRRDRAAAEQQVRAAVELADRLYREAPQEADVKSLAAAYLHFGEWFQWTLQLGEAEVWQRKTLVLAREHRLGEFEGWSLSSLGSIYKAQKRIREAQAAFEEGLRAFDRYESDPEHFEDWEGKAALLSSLSDLVRETGDADKADAILAEAGDLYERLADNFPRYQYLATPPIGTQQALARHLSQRGRPDAADSWLRKAADRAAGLARTRPTERQYLRLAFDVQAERVRMWQAAGRKSEAKAVLAQLSEFLGNRVADPACVKAVSDELTTVSLSFAALQAEAGDNDGAGQTLRRELTRIEKLAEKSPEHVGHRKSLAETYAALAQHLLTMQNPLEAIKASAKSIDMWPGSQRAWLVRGRAYQALQQPDKALIDLSKAIELAPTDGATPWAYLSRSSTYTALKQDDKALADLSKAIELWPKLFDAWHWRGSYYLERNAWDKALEDFTKVLELNPNYWPDWQSRGAIHARHGRWQQAIHDYGKVIELNPKNAPILDTQAWLLANCPDAKLRDPERAVGHARRAVDLEPKNASYRGTLGAALYRAGDWKAAVSELNQAIKDRGENGRDMLWLAMSHAKLAQKTEASRWYEKANAWVERHAPKDEELNRLREEAAGVLGVPPHPKPQRLDVPPRVVPDGKP